MKNILCLIFLAGAFATQAQTSNNSLLSHIPADADKVFHVNLGAIGSKIDWLSVASLMKGHNLGGQHPMNLNIQDMTAFLSSGIDFRQDVIVVESNAYHIDSTRYQTFLVHLTDSGKFAAFIHTQAHNLRMLHLGGKDRIAVDKDKAAAWNDNLAVMVTAKLPKTADSTALLHMLGNRLGRRAAAALHGFSNTYFVTDPRFTTAFSDDADFHVWNRHGAGFESVNKLLFGAKGNPQLNGLAQLASKANADATVGTLRFETGKITYHNLKLITPGERSGLDRLTNSSLSNDLVAAIPPGELMGLIAIHYNMAAWVDSIGKMPIAAMFTGKLKDKGITLADLSHALKGNFMVLAYAPNKNTPSADAGTGAGTGAGAKPKMPLIYLAATIDDKATFSRLATTVKLSDAASASSATAAGDTATHHSPFVYYATQNDLAVIGGNRDQVNGFFNHPANTSNPASKLLTERAGSNPFTLAIDMHAVADFLTPLLTKDDTISKKNQTLLNSLRRLDVMQWSSGAIKDDALESYFELRFTDQNKNALANLMDIVSSLNSKKTDSPQ